MSWLFRLPLPWLFNRRVGLALLKGLLAGLAVAMIIACLRLGSVEDWQRWMSGHAGLFLVWRLLLYAFIAWSWFCLRHRLRQYEPSPEAHQRWRRAEIAVVVSIVLLEVSQGLR